MSVNQTSRQIEVFPEFKGASCVNRYNLLCCRLLYEMLHSAESVLALPLTAASTGCYLKLAKLTELQSFETTLAGHIPAEAQRQCG